MELVRFVVSSFERATRGPCDESVMLRRMRTLLELVGARWELVGARWSSLELVGIRTVDPHGPRAARSHELATNLTSYENELQFVRFHIPVRLVARTPRSSFERADNEPNELQKRASILLSDTQTP